MLWKQIFYNENIGFIFDIWITGAPYCQGSPNYLILFCFVLFSIQFSKLLGAF